MMTIKASTKNVEIKFDSFFKRDMGDQNELFNEIKYWLNERYFVEEFQDQQLFKYLRDENDSPTFSSPL